MNLVHVTEAMQFTGHRRQQSFNGYLWRINNALPVEHQVVRVRDRIDLDSLQAALALYSRQYKSKRGRKVGVQ